MNLLSQFNILINRINLKIDKTSWETGRKVKDDIEDQLRKRNICVVNRCKNS